MSGIVGCYNLDGGPVDRSLLQRMIKRIGHRGPDGSGLWSDGPAGLGHLALHTTPESLREQQPLADESGTLCLTLDGRVDNRVELGAGLLAKGFAPRADTDAELVLQAYRCWSESCAAHIIGDFAFAIWDRKARRLFCARDVVGIRPFYYFSNGRTFVFASEPRALFEHPSVSRTPNESVIAQYLTETFMNNEDTLFRDIRRLPPAHFMAVDRNETRCSRYWDIDPGRAIRYRTDAEYAEHFHALFREAVRCRLRSHVPVASELSGGLDSSSIVGMAQSLYREGAVPRQDFETLSMIFPGQPCDESPYINAVVRHWDLRANLAAGAVCDAAHYEKQVREDWYFPDAPNGVAQCIPLYQIARQKGIRVVLDGLGGDDWFTGGDFRYAELLRKLRLVTLLREIFRGDQDRESASPARQLLRGALWPLLPIRLRMAVRAVLGRDRIPRWITRNHARFLPPAEKLCAEPVRRQFASFDLTYMHDRLGGTYETQSREIVDRGMARMGLELRSPFLDRRLIEFAFAIPDDQRWRGGYSKYVLRQAMGRELPDVVRWRTTKAEFSRVYFDTLRAADVHRVFDRLALNRLGWIDADAVRAMRVSMARSYESEDETYATLISSVWPVFGIELWLNEMRSQE